ncbi:recombinase family protein [Streptomyces sp. NPDC057654]|uniref:recombinase family protein n=1 Tax=Streptomyces sp. NPDC057654 TaxID=3346196 RepID=UPI00368B909E
MITSEYDGCGKCLVGVRRLSRKTDSTNSPQKQQNHILSAVEAVGGHVIAWADDWEVSGATNPLTRPKLGPWLRGEMGPYAGIAGAAVDRIGRNVVDVLNTGYAMRDAGKLLVTYGHDGPWDLDDPNDENQFIAQAWGAQMELRSIQKRNRDETKRARAAGQPKQKNRYGYRFVRLIPTGQVDHVELDPVASLILRDVAERILVDETGKVTVHTEAARLNRAGVLSPADHRSVMYGRKPKGTLWNAKAIKRMLISEASLGYLMHDERPVVGSDGHAVRIAEPLWDRATRDALVEKTAPKWTGSRAPKGVRMLSGIALCGVCGQRLYQQGRTDQNPAYGCTARVRGIPSSAKCKPAPTMSVPMLDKRVEGWFLAEYGHHQVRRKEFDPGTGHTARIAEIEADRTRLRGDRQAGLYESEADTEWYRTEYARMTREIEELKQLPERPAGMRWVPLGRTIEDDWNAAPDDAARREMLAGFDVRVSLHPRGARHRVRMTGLDPEQRALEQGMAQEHAELAALADLEDVE